MAEVSVRRHVQAAREEALELRGRVGVLETSLGDATALIQALSEQVGGGDLRRMSNRP